MQSIWSSFTSHGAGFSTRTQNRIIRGPLKPFSRFVIATNNLFHVDDKSEGFYRRLLVVRFNYSIPENQQDRGLVMKLRGEMPGILNWALEGLARLERRGSFIIPASVKAEVDEYRRANNPVTAWVAECCELDTLAWSAFSDIYPRYRAWALEMGHRPLSAPKFSTEVQRIPGVQKAQSPNRETRQRGFFGIRV